MAEILFIATSHDRMLDGAPTGLWLEEFAVPYIALTGKGHDVVISSVAGGKVPVDPRSAPLPGRAREWSVLMEALDESVAFNDLMVDDFEAVYIPGGHGAVFDMPDNQGIHDLLFRAETRNAVIASICHGPAVFAGMRRPDGAPFVLGRRVSAYTDSEERAGDHAANVPFLLETRLRELGADFVRKDDWMPNVVADGRLLTGQNSQSSTAMAAAILALLAS